VSPLNRRLPNGITCSVFLTGRDAVLAAAAHLDGRPFHDGRRPAAAFRAVLGDFVDALLQFLGVDQAPLPFASRSCRCGI
jgi:hypothetical protein